MNVTFNSLPQTLPRENAVKLELEQGVIIFRASDQVSERIEELLEKEKTFSLTPEETQELNVYEEIDDYLSHVNRLIRNSAENLEVNLAA
jgi:uncharacterized protein YnzC (UPF0291/DUF896 family)